MITIRWIRGRPRSRNTVRAGKQRRRREIAVRYGKIGTDGQTKTKDFGSAALAQKDADKLIGEKTKKGYEEV